MSRTPPFSDLGLPDEQATALGEDGATRIRSFRLILLLAQQLRTLMDQQLRDDGLTTQQAALITIVDTLGQPSITQAAVALGTTHQNVKQLASSLARKGFIRFLEDPSDARMRRMVSTAKSHTTWERRGAADQQRVLEWFSALSKQDADALFELLLKLQTTVQAALESPRKATTLEHP
jgi:DNA-binding MarR family transcriptional regulator